MWVEMQVLHRSGIPRSKREAGTWLFGQFVPDGGVGGGGYASGGDAYNAAGGGTPHGGGGGDFSGPTCCPCQQGLR